MPKDVLEKATRDKTKRVFVDLKQGKAFIVDWKTGRITELKKEEEEAQDARETAT